TFRRRERMNCQRGCRINGSAFRPQEWLACKSPSSQCHKYAVHVTLTMLGTSLGSGGDSGGLNPLYQIGGPRSVQLALKLLF
ncbi:MAG TPA: hypothetical protein VK603_18650, partial [Candidatus Saccharimonadales bacterium]|nr:hypothetical protein [Candidatus Saccharimonadales bacterium]